MKILHLTDLFHPSIGGLESHVLNLVRERQRRGHEISVVTLTLQGPPSRRIEDTGYLVYRIASGATKLTWLYENLDRPFSPPFPDPIVSRELRRIVDHDMPDAVHAHNWMAYSYLAIKRPDDPPLLWMQHDYSLGCPKKTAMYSHGDGVCPGASLTHCLTCAPAQYGRLKGTAITVGLRAANRVLTKKTDKLVANSTPVVRFDEDSVLSAERMEVVGTFVGSDLAAESLSVPRPDFLPPDDGYILFVGALGAHKGVYELLDAYSRLREGKPPLVFLGTPQPDSPSSWPDDVIVQHNVDHAQVMSAWRHCGIGVIPSKWAEPFGLVAVEASSMGKPIVASRIGGLADLVLDGVTGFAVAPGNVSELTTALQRLVDDPELRRILGEQGVTFAQRFSVTSVTDHLDEVTQNMIDEHRAARGRTN